MFANLLQLLNRHLSPEDDRAFIRDIQVQRPIPRNRRSELLLLVGWALIAIKSVAMFWLVEHYTMPFNAWWIVGPTLLAAAVCTWIYWRRD